MTKKLHSSLCRALDNTYTTAAAAAAAAAAATIYGGSSGLSWEATAKRSHTSTTAAAVAAATTTYRGKVPYCTSWYSTALFLYKTSAFWKALTRLPTLRQSGERLPESQCFVEEKYRTVPVGPLFL